MTTHTLRPRGIVTVGVMILSSTVGCSNFQDRLLAAPDPDVINPATVNSPAGASAPITDPAPMVAFSPIVTGATSALLDPMKAPSQIIDEPRAGDPFRGR